MPTIDEHLKTIDEWVEEIVEDRKGDRYAITADQCYSDVVHSYLAAEIDDPKVKREILRRTGL